MRDIGLLRLAPAILLVLLVSSATATAGAPILPNTPLAPATPDQLDPTVAEDLPTPAASGRPASAYAISAMAAGALAGAIVGDILTGGLIIPVLGGVLVASTVTETAASSAAYAVSVASTAISAGLGAYAGHWLTAGN